MKPHYDAVIVGGGHNGLTCGAYLSRAGVKVLVAERREVVGGAAVTEEIAPGYRSSMASYYQGLLQPKVILDLELQKYGFEVLPAHPTVFALEGGRTFTMWDDPEKFAAEICKLSNSDGQAYARYRAHMQKIAPFMKQLLWEVPVNPGSGKIGDLKRLAGFVWRFRKIGPQFFDIYKLLTMSAYDYLSRWFESEDAKLVLGFFAGGGGANSSLKTPGSAYMLARGIVRDGNTPAGPAGFMKGGMSTISEAIRRSGEAYGMEVHTGVPVERILVDDGRAVGIRLAGGEEICSKIVVANATARTVFTKLIEPSLLPEDFNRDIRNIRCESTVFRVNLVLKSLPDAPVFAQAAREDGVLSQMTIAPSVAYMERAHRIAQEGEIADEPFLIVKVPSMVDPTLAPPGQHIINIFGGHAPYTLARGTWDERREELWANVLKVLKTQFPDIEGHILHRQVMTPLDLERIFDLPNGHVHHGEISADQMFFCRFSPNYADYRSPIERLYQASASVHPGGGVTGVPGHNAAKVILEDRAKWS
ncbi:phytoene desaturase family protein [Mesorhizobium sp. PUT5]|uniref:phytoene desaturase family protein n=1 Tax=Mesorhizobium sp. PUT5 TaxID=3454629 RepID=UPI003FA4B653